MTEIDLAALAARESEQVEWKENVADENDVVRTLAAFANDLQNLGGGYVVCGVREARDEHGFPRFESVGLTASRLKEIEGIVLARCLKDVTPPLHPVVREVAATAPERRVLVFVMPTTGQAHAVRAVEGTKYYVRISRQTREARNGVFRDLMVLRGAMEPWDRRVCALASAADLDLLVLRDATQRLGLGIKNGEVERYVSAEERFSAFVPPLCTTDPLTGILRPRNFAILLFGRDVQRFVPGAVAFFSTYPGIDRAGRFGTRHEFAGTLLDQARLLLPLLDAQAPVAFDKENALAPNTVRYPRRALHEALVNALAHRDYEDPAPTRVTAFADRIEFDSPGSLPRGVDATQFVEGRASPRWRNQALAWFLMRLQLAQAEGQGIPTILRTMREEGCPAPRFELDPSRVLCVLPARRGELGAAPERSAP